MTLRLAAAEAPTTYRLWIPKWRPTPYNTVRGRHWSREAKAKKEMIWFLSVYATEGGVPVARGPRHVRLKIILGPRQRQHDADAFDKLLLDSMKRAGLLTDDSASGLVGRVEVEFERGTKDNWGTEITLTDEQGA